jgi:hypothetical protein
MDFLRVIDSGKMKWKELEDFLRCSDSISITYAESEPSNRLEITLSVSDVHSFLTCAAKYVDEHTLSSWERQAEGYKAGKKPKMKTGAYACTHLPS